MIRLSTVSKNRFFPSWDHSAICRRRMKPAIYLRPRPGTAGHTPRIYPIHRTSTPSIAHRAKTPAFISFAGCAQMARVCLAWDGLDRSHPRAASRCQNPSRFVAGKPPGVRRAKRRVVPPELFLLTVSVPYPRRRLRIHNRAWLFSRAKWKTMCLPSGVQTGL